MTNYAEGRKKHVWVDTDMVIHYVAESMQPLSPHTVAQVFGISVPSARRKLDAGVERHDLIRDEYDAEGHPLPYEHWRYCDASA